MTNQMFWKKIGSVLLALCLLWAAACSRQPIWQEQYDLGMRYLTESNYEQAIIAFTAAIEIDPNHSEAYLNLSEIYWALGDMDLTLQILQQGIDQTGDAGLQERLEELQQYISSYLPDPTFAQRAAFQPFLSLPEEQQRFIDEAVTLAEEGRTDEISALALDMLEMDVMTMYKGYKIQAIVNPEMTYESYARAKGMKIENPLYSYGLGIILQIRPENGQGYFYSYLDKLAGSEEGAMAVNSNQTEIILSDCKDWQFEEGEYTGKVVLNTNIYMIYFLPDASTGEQIPTQGEITGTGLTELSFEGLVSHNTFLRQRGHEKTSVQDGAGNSLQSMEDEIVYTWNGEELMSIEIGGSEKAFSVSNGEYSVGAVRLEDW